MDEIPELIRETQKELPGQFQDLKYGCRDLKVEGYDLMLKSMVQYKVLRQN